MVKFIPRMYKVKTQTKYLSLLNDVQSIVFGNTRARWSRGSVSKDTHRGASEARAAAAGFTWYSGVYHKQVQTS